MSASNLMDLTGSGSINSAVTTVPQHHNSNNSSEDEETVAIVLACVLITVIVAAFCRWVYGMAKQSRKENTEQEAVVTVEENPCNCEESNTCSQDNDENEEQHVEPNYENQDLPSNKEVTPV